MWNRRGGFPDRDTATRLGSPAKPARSAAWSPRVNLPQNRLAREISVTEGSAAAAMNAPRPSAGASFQPAKPADSLGELAPDREAETVEDDEEDRLVVRQRGDHGIQDTLDGERHVAGPAALVPSLQQRCEALVLRVALGGSRFGNTRVGVRHLRKVISAAEGMPGAVHEAALQRVGCGSFAEGTERLQSPLREPAHNSGRHGQTPDPCGVVAGAVVTGDLANTGPGGARVVGVTRFCGAAQRVGRFAHPGVKPQLQGWAEPRGALGPDRSGRRCPRLRGPTRRRIIARKAIKHPTSRLGEAPAHVRIDRDAPDVRLQPHGSIPELNARYCRFAEHNTAGQCDG